MSALIADYIVETLHSTTIALEHEGDLQIIRRSDDGHRVITSFGPDQHDAARYAVNALNRLENAFVELHQLGVETRQTKLEALLAAFAAEDSQCNVEQFLQLKRSARELLQEGGAA